MKLPFSPMQLRPEYHNEIPGDFFAWYFLTFTNYRRPYGHWSATCRSTSDAAYHRDILYAGSEDEIPAGAKRIGLAYLVTNEQPDVDLGAHTWERNTDAWAICLQAMADGTMDSEGTQSPEPDQIRLFIDVLAEDCTNMHVPIGAFMTHEEAADLQDYPEDLQHQAWNFDLGSTEANDEAAQALGMPHAGYGPNSRDFERWDLDQWIDKTTLKLTPPSQSCPVGSIKLADYIRGQAIMIIVREQKSKYSSK